MRFLRLTTLAILAAATAIDAAETARHEPFETGAALKSHGPIDDLVLRELARRGIEPASPCSDGVFLRRAYLDVIGTLPTAAEARAFLADAGEGKRAALVERLLERPERADYWAMKWSDRLRVKSEFPINLWPNAVQAYHRWIRTAMAENRPYDRFARELLTASGSNFRVPPVNFYRALPRRDPAAIAQAVALTFMGTRTERWPDERLAGMAAFFAQVAYKPTAEWKEEIVFFDPGRPAGSAAVFPDGRPAMLTPGRDPREAFADWLIAADNPWFARAAANRIWSWLFGRGLVDEPDDMRPDNPPVHPEVLAYLERELIATGYDLRHLYRLILTSQVYQLSPLLRREPPDAAALFARYAVRPIEAEVLVDALDRATGTSEEYESRIPEPFGYAPAGQRAIALADGSVTSAFLETFGRPPRDTGRESERSLRPTAGQRLLLLNSSRVQTKLAALGSLPLDDLYLTLLARFPTDGERSAARAYLSRAANRRDATVDVAWALVNGVEFLHRH